MQSQDKSKTQKQGPSLSAIILNDLIKGIFTLVLAPFWLILILTKLFLEKGFLEKNFVKNKVFSFIFYFFLVFSFCGLTTLIFFQKQGLKFFHFFKMELSNFQFFLLIYGFLVLGFLGGCPLLFRFIFSNDDRAGFKNFVKKLFGLNFFRSENKSRITVKNLDKKVKNFSGLLPLLDDSKNIPIGISIQSQRPFVIPVLQSLEHILICGATGVGKTSLLMTMLQHCLRHKYPAIIIDPKRDFTDLDVVRDLAKLFHREADLLIFSLSDPEESCSFNPLKLGTPENKKSKLMDGLNLSHEYYGSIAAMALLNIFEILDALGEPSADLPRVLSILMEAEVRAQIEQRLVNLPESKENRLLLNNLKSLRQIPVKDLSGLCAQLQNFTVREFRGIMTGTSKKKEIDLLDVLMSGKIAYFRLNTNAYSDVAKRFGKLLIEDLKLTSNIIQSHRELPRAQFAGIFIDEFGSFATKDFSNIQKMVRSAGISLRLFYQGMADLRAVSPEFEDQVLGNTLTKIILRQDIDADVQKWSGMAGTTDDLIQSYQIEESFFSFQQTGMGNMHEGKKVKIDFDVFKELGKGQAVVIDKGRKIQDIIEIWDSKNSEFLPILKKYIHEVNQKKSQSEEDFFTKEDPFSFQKMGSKLTENHLSFGRGLTPSFKKSMRLK